MQFTEAFAVNLASRLEDVIKDSNETALRLWRLLDPAQGGPGNTQEYPPTAGWLNSFEQAAVTALISTRALEQTLATIRVELELSGKRAQADLEESPDLVPIHIVTYCTECAEQRGLPPVGELLNVAQCTYCARSRKCWAVQTSAELSGRTEQLVKAEIIVAAEREEAERTRPAVV